MDWYDGIFERFAEKHEVEIIDLVVSAFYRNVEEIAHTFIYFFDKLLVGKRIADALFKRSLVGVFDKHHHVGPLPVASGASGFLIILFERVGNVDVCHDAHVGLVDAHAESVCRNDYAGLPQFPLVLAVRFVVVVKSGVVEVGRNAVSG